MAYGQNSQVVKDFIRAAQEHCIKIANDHVGIYELHRWGIHWTKVQSKKCRPLDSVVLGDGIAEKLVADIQKFSQNEEWYKKKGIPYRRGYLLYGPPGTGKTSFTQAIAGALGYNICYLNLSGNRLDDDGLNRALNVTPAKSIILLEDIDGIFVDRESVNMSSYYGKRVTFSGLLNALDGVRSQEGRILFMTTNHREKLDPALLRPGRADFQVQLNNASQMQLKTLFTKFYPGEDKMAEKFCKRLPEFKVSMAKLQGYFLQHRSNAKNALENYKNILHDQTTVDQMGVAEWLERMNMSQYLRSFNDQKVNTVTDMRMYQDAGTLMTQFKVKEFMHQQRILSMIQNDALSKADFEYVTVNQARQHIMRHVKNSELLEKLVECVEEKTLTGFQIKDILIANSKFDDIKKAIEAQVKVSQNPLKDLRLGKELEKEETEDQKKTRMGFPKKSADSVLKECNLEETIPKLAENKITNDIFWQLDEGQLESLLKVELFGVRKALFKKMQETKKEHEEAFKKSEEIPKVFHSKDGLLELLDARNTTY